MSENNSKNLSKWVMLSKVIRSGQEASDAHMALESQLQRSIAQVLLAKLKAERASEDEINTSFAEARKAVNL